MDRESYVDATQRGIIRAMGASSIGKSSQIPQSSPPTSANSSSVPSSATLSPPAIQRTLSASSTGSTGCSNGSAKKGFFRRRKD
ncbi:hypothetical protein K435DRAFT_364751 [Dendrothele bispora CBS 962.96]|uniref:Uncharacterized protein n=1 Tax=Dendrothele bispora (strain CBS 962.96) TaxID=1314807 RepID=A0A4S8LC31_DENBC|nr:hypothetical protein K435DRAFT_364751 [Dendrothele bispora CBS 962.96]